METALTKRFGDGEYRFALYLPQIIEIERACALRSGDGTMVPKSVFTIYEQLGQGLLRGDDGELHYIGGGAALLGDVRAVIRAGLIGGGGGVVDGQEIEIGPVRAGELLDAYTFPARPIIEGVQLAWAILHAAIIGIDVKKKDAPVTADPQP